MTETAHKEKHITWKMYAAGYFISFLIVLSRFEPPYREGELIVAGMFSFILAFFVCSGWNLLGGKS